MQPGTDRGTEAIPEQTIHAPVRTAITLPMRDSFYSGVSSQRWAAVIRDCRCSKSWQLQDLLSKTLQLDGRYLGLETTTPRLTWYYSSSKLFHSLSKFGTMPFGSFEVAHLARSPIEAPLWIYRIGISTSSFLISQVRRSTATTLWAHLRSVRCIRLLGLQLDENASHEVFRSRPVDQASRKVCGSFFVGRLSLVAEERSCRSEQMKKVQVVPAVDVFQQAATMDL